MVYKFSLLVATSSALTGVAEPCSGYARNSNSFYMLWSSRLYFHVSVIQYHWLSPYMGLLNWYIMQSQRFP